MWRVQTRERRKCIKTQQTSVGCGAADRKLPSACSRAEPGAGSFAHTPGGHGSAYRCERCVHGLHNIYASFPAPGGGQTCASVCARKVTKISPPYKITSNIDVHTRLPLTMKMYSGTEAVVRTRFYPTNDITTCRRVDRSGHLPTLPFLRVVHAAAAESASLSAKHHPKAQRRLE